MMRSLSSSIKRKTKKKLFSSKKKGGSARGDRRQGTADGVEEGADDPATVAGQSYVDSAAFFGLARSGDSSYESLERAKEEGKAFELQNMEEVRQAHVERDMLKAMGPVALAFQNEIQMEARPATPNTSANDLLLGSAEPAAATTTTMTTTEEKGKEKAGEAEALQHIVYGDADYYVLLVLTHLPREVLYRIFSFLQPMDLLNVGQTCTLLKEVSEDEYLWRALYYYSKEKHHLEHNPYKAKRRKWGNEQLTWRERYKLTFVVKQRKSKGKKKIRKLLGGTDNELFLNLNCSVFECQEASEPDQYITGEVTINVRSEKVVTHGLYLMVYGQEAFRSYDAARNAIRKSKRPVLGFYLNILGDTPWKERKRNTITLYRGTYRYPIRCVFPKKSLLDQRLPPSFLRMMPKTGSYFRVEYYASVVLGLPFPHSNVMSMKHNILLHNSKRMDRKLKTRVERVAGSPAHEAVEKRFLMKADRRARFEAHLDKTFFYLDEEAITITCNIDNRCSRSRVHAVSVTVLEILGESQVCREIVKRGAGGVGRWQLVADNQRGIRPNGDDDNQNDDNNDDNDEGQQQRRGDDGDQDEADGEEMELHEEGDNEYDEDEEGDRLGEESTEGSSPEVEERPAWAGRRRGSLGSSGGASSAAPPLPGRRRNSIAGGEQSSSSSSSSSSSTPSQTHDVIRRSSLGGAGAGVAADPQAFMQRRRNSLAGEPGATRREPVSNNNSGGASSRYPEMGRRLGEKRIYHVQVDAGEMLRGVELTYPVRWGDVLGESLFNTATFHQTYLLVVSFHMSFGRIDPRVRIPIFLIKRC